LPTDVASALADAFWHHYGAGRERSAAFFWSRLKIFSRFVVETNSVRCLGDFGSQTLGRYIEWLGRQTSGNGKPWSKTTRSLTYGTLRTLLQWLERCRPGVLAPIEHPSNPFPWRNRDMVRRPKASALDLRALLRACERDIERLRGERQQADEERENARQGHADPRASRGALLAWIDVQFGGVLPSNRELVSGGNWHGYETICRHGGRQHIESLLYPSVGTILPYYLAILIHTAGNPRAIVQITGECLQSIPLLEDRELLVWMKPRSTAPQRRSFRRTASFEPPALVRELIMWTRRLRSRVTESEQDKLFLVKGSQKIQALANVVLVKPLRAFEARHSLKHIAPASVRPTVLTAIYRSTGDLVRVKGIANHARLSTTVAYVETPEVEVQNRGRIATLQQAFLGHIGAMRGSAREGNIALKPKKASRTAFPFGTPAGKAVSMFGFDCADPLSGIAPGTRTGELCDSFLGCFSCPNAVIPRDARTLAKLLQARNHLKAAATEIHPARWHAVYAPSLRILEEDILMRFVAQDLAQAERLLDALPPLPPLR
jgi:hypothetical protein